MPEVLVELDGVFPEGMMTAGCVVDVTCKRKACQMLDEPTYLKRMGGSDYAGLRLRVVSQSVSSSVGLYILGSPSSL